MGICKPDWVHWEKIGDYDLWCYSVYNSGKILWNVTKTGNPPTNWAGYPTREAILKLKGLDYE